MPTKSRHELEPAEERRLYYEGIRLFNAGEFFEAHEVWEDVWHMATGKKYKFYQGLIQAAVTFEHLRRGNRRGCLTVYGTCIPKFDDLPNIYMGLEILPFLQSVRAGIAHVLNDPQADVKPRLDKLFQIELQYDPFETPRATDVP